MSKLPKPKRPTLMDLVEQTVASAKARGLPDMSGKEIQDEINRKHGRFLEMSTLSSRIKTLVDVGRLARDLKYSRPCRVTAEKICPVALPPVQARIAGVN